MKISFSSLSLPEKGSVVFLVSDGGDLGPMASQFDSRHDGLLAGAMKAADFSGKKGRKADILAPCGLNMPHVILMGIGKPEDLNEQTCMEIGGAIAAALPESEKKVAVVVELPAAASMELRHVAAQLAAGARMGSYRFDSYKTKKDKKSKSVEKLVFLVEKPGSASRVFSRLDAVVDGVFLARDLVNEPANILFPDSFARRCRNLDKAGLAVEVLDEKQMDRLGMHALLGVGQGSRRNSRLVVMRWKGAVRASDPVTAFVGKGVTFDSGGISIKPGAGMGDMKGDMGGAACVAGLMLALAGRKARINAVGVLGLVENMPDGAAQRPGDVVTSMSGQTIEILNTDAEGRLVLADALTYVCETVKPARIIDLATLTGAILVALGREHAGLFSNDDELAAQLSRAGEATGEKVWRLPLGKAYDKLIDSTVADMKNIGGRFAGSITAAQFLKRFVGETPWAHLDIAGTAMDSPKTDISRSWASGFGVRLLDRFVNEYLEN